MSFATSQDAKERIRQAIDIVDLVGSSLSLRRQGRIFVGLCPWHDDSRPSLQVNPERQSWKCWVCNIGGDVFSFVMKREGVEFKEALEMLADRAGVTLPSAGSTAPSKAGEPGDKRTLYAVTAWAERQFHQCLLTAPEAEPARRYLRDRRLTAESIERFRLGYSPDQWQWLTDRARSVPYSLTVLEAAGLVGRSSTTNRPFERFKGRVIFPIRDTQDRPIGFGGRILPEFAKPDSAKYINSPETRIFSKSEHVYGLNLARELVSQNRRVAVVEGYTDVIMAHQSGLREFVAVLGTALGQRHIQLLRRYADSIVLVLDGDEAGKRRTNEVLELFVASDVDLRILTLPEGLDPCDFLIQRSGEALRELMAATVDAFEHAIRVRTEGVDLVRDTHRANKALESVLSILAKSPRSTTHAASAKQVRERQVLARLAREFGVEEMVLRTRIQDLRRDAPVARRGSEVVGSARPATVADLDPFDAELLEILVRHPALANAAMASITVEQLATEPARVIYQAYVQLSRTGQEADFGRALATLEDLPSKSLLVELDERARAKEEFALEDAAARLRRVIDDIGDRRLAAKRREQMAALEKRSLSEQEEKQALLQLFEQKRIEQEARRQGSMAPADG